jgi:hypothetical protein
MEQLQKSVKVVNSQGPGDTLPIRQYVNQLSKIAFTTFITLTN